MSRLSTALYGELEDVICTMDDARDISEVSAAVMNLARHIQGIEQRLEQLERREGGK